MVLLFDPVVDWALLGSLHLLGAAVPGAIGYCLWRRGWLTEVIDEDEDEADFKPIDSRLIWFGLLTALCALASALGVGLCLIAALAHRYFLTKAQPFDDWYAELFPEEEHALAEDLYGDLLRTLHRLSGPQYVVPFIDVIRHGSRDQKQMAIGLMSRHFRREFAPALREALGDTDNSVRIQAATAIANVENRFYERLQQLRKLAEEEPSPATELQLARQFDDYAFTGLLDADREMRNREEALVRYQSYLEQRPDDVRANLALVRLYVKMDKPLEALTALERAPRGTVNSMEMAAWRMEALYRIGGFEAIRGIAKDLVDGERDGRPIPPAFASAVRLWAGIEPDQIERANLDDRNHPGASRARRTRRELAA